MIFEKLSRALLTNNVLILAKSHGAITGSLKENDKYLPSTQNIFIERFIFIIKIIFSIQLYLNLILS